MNVQRRHNLPSFVSVGLRVPVVWDCVCVFFGLAHLFAVICFSFRSEERRIQLQYYMLHTTSSYSTINCTHTKITHKICRCAFRSRTPRTRVGITHHFMYVCMCNCLVQSGDGLYRDKTRFVHQIFISLSHVQRIRVLTTPLRSIDVDNDWMSIWVFLKIFVIFWHRITCDIMEATSSRLYQQDMRKITIFPVYKHIFNVATNYIAYAALWSHSWMVYIKVPSLIPKNCRRRWNETMRRDDWVGIQQTKDHISPQPTSTGNNDNIVAWCLRVILYYVEDIIQNDILQSVGGNSAARADRTRVLRSSRATVCVSWCVCVCVCVPCIRTSNIISWARLTCFSKGY